MNNTELNSILKKARLPEISEESLATFPRHVLAQLGQETAHPSPAPRRQPPALWALGWATACVVAIFAFGFWQGRVRSASAGSGDVLASGKFAAETLAMFPNQVRSIVQDARGLRLVLSERQDVPVSPPLYIRVCDGQNCSSFVTFSGQQIQLAGQSVTVLSNPRGGIILAGEKFVWSNTQGGPADPRWKIEAKTLNPMAM